MFAKNFINLSLQSDNIWTSLVKQDSFTFKIEIIKTILEFDGYIYLLKIQNAKKDDFKLVAFSRKAYYTIQDAREAAYQHLTNYADKYSDYLTKNLSFN